jgi:hypothetical protein
MIPPVLTAVTLGVRDVAAASRFYQALGFARKFKATGDAIAFIDAGGVVLALWSWDQLAADIGVEPRSAAFRGMTLAWNCRSAAEVDAAYARGVAAGGKPLRPPGNTDYGGYRGYFADPDGHVWEAVCAPGFTFTEDGRLVLPD